MTHEEFEKNINEVFTNCKKILIEKGREYQSTQNEGHNVFANFQRIGKDLNLNQESVLWVYFSKHRDSIATFIKDLEKTNSIEALEEKLTEPINGRILDAINYLLLLDSMIQCRRK